MKKKLILLTLNLFFLQVFHLFAQIDFSGNTGVGPGTTNSAIGQSNTISNSNNSFASGLKNTIITSYGCTAAGTTNTITKANASAVFGDHCFASGTQSFAAGAYTRAEKDFSFALGWNNETKAINAFTIGSGDAWFNTGPLVNNTENSLIIGFNSTSPTLSVAGATGNNTIGHVGIGIGPDDPLIYSHMLSVKGDIIAERVQVKLYSNWPDYVFAKEYKLPTIYELDQFITQNSHLPEIPNCEQIKNEGYDLADMDAKLLKKIEELTLYVIDLKKENDNLKALINTNNKAGK